MTEEEKQKIFSREVFKVVDRMSGELQMTPVSVDGCLGCIQKYLFNEHMYDELEIDIEFDDTEEPEES